MQLLSTLWVKHNWLFDGKVARRGNVLATAWSSEQDKFVLLVRTADNCLSEWTATECEVVSSP